MGKSPEGLDVTISALFDDKPRYTDRKHALPPVPAKTVDNRLSIGFHHQGFKLVVIRVQTGEHLDHTTVHVAIDV